MSLSQLLQESFRGDVRFRGSQLFKTEQVTITRVTADSVLAEVRDGSTYQTHVGRNDGNVKLGCSCTPDRPQGSCRHLFATLLAIDAGGLVTPGARSGHIPPFAAEAPASTGPDLWEDDPTRDVYVPPTRARSLRDTILVQPLLRPWEQRLQSLAHALSSEVAPAPGETPARTRERELFFELDPKESADRGAIVVQLTQRQRRTNGQWGKCKAYKLRSGALDRIDREEDRRILAHLLGGTPERTGWAAQQAELQSSVSRFQLPFSLAEIVLPLLCQTERFRLTGASDATPVLTWTDGPPWELRLEVLDTAASAATGEAPMTPAEVALGEIALGATDADANTLPAEPQTDATVAETVREPIQTASLDPTAVEAPTRRQTSAARRKKKAVDATADAAAADSATSATAEPAQVWTSDSAIDPIEPTGTKSGANGDLASTKSDAEGTDVEDGYHLTAILQRGDERIPLAAPDLIVPGGFVVHQGVVGRLQDYEAFAWIPMLRREEHIHIPREDGAALVDRLLDMTKLPRLQLPAALRLEEVRALPTPHLLLHTGRGTRWQHERLQGEVSFEYEQALIRSSSPQMAIVQRDQGRCLLRDAEREEVAWGQILQAGVKRLQNLHQGRYDVELPAKSLGPVVRELIKVGWQIHADGKQLHQPGQLEMRVQSGIDWFELHAQVDFNGRTVAFPELLAALARGDCTVRLSDGSLGILPEEWFQQYGLLAGLGAAEGDHVRFARNQVGLLDALLAAQPVEFDAGFHELKEKIQNFTGIEVTKEPEGFQGELRGYQRDGFGWLSFLLHFRFGGCLADDMGLGKTIQLLALLQERRNNRETHAPSLIVVPKSLIFNWRQECEKFTPGLKLLEYVGLHRTRARKKFAKADLVLTTYGTVRRDILALKETQFDLIVLDEAQAIKNAGSQVAKACRLLKGTHKLALSGTPIENRLSDLWSIFEFLNPGMLGRASVFKMQTADANDQASRKLLSQALKPFILRRTKKEVARDLPEKLEQTILCNLGKTQETLYNEMRDHYRNSLLGMIKQQGLARSKIHVLEALLRLRQAACHPGLLDAGRVEESSAKLDVLTLHLQELLSEGHKALVFSQFTSFLAIVRKHLDAQGITYEYLDGQTRDRKKPIDHFQNDPACGVFLISLKTGGLGLNLTAADYVFLLDPWWNPAVEMQAIDRAHRLGQSRKVFAYRLIVRNTVEEKIAELQSKKKSLADAILQADNNLIQDLSAEDLDLLLT